jgi:hypothetical protein
MTSSFSLLRREFDTLGLFMFNTSKELMETVFFSTQAQYIAFYQGLLVSHYYGHRGDIVTADLVEFNPTQDVCGKLFKEIAAKML